MLIDIKTLPISELPNFQGGEKTFYAHMFNDGMTKILLGKLEPGASIGLHSHDTSCEVIYCLCGSGKCLCDGQEERIAPGMVQYCAKGHAHTLINDGSEDLTFFAVVPVQ